MSMVPEVITLPKFEKIDCKGKDKNTKVCKDVDRFVVQLMAFLNMEKKAFQQRKYDIEVIKSAFSEPEMQKVL